MDKNLLITLNFVHFCLGITFTMSVNTVHGKKPVGICVSSALEAHYL